MRALFRVVALFLAGCLSPVPASSDWKQHALQGQVHTVYTKTVHQYPEGNGGFFVTAPVFSLQTFDQQGNLVRLTRSGEDGTLFDESDYVYDAEGRVTQADSYVYTIPQEPSHAKHTYTYDELGRKVEEADFTSDGLNYRTVYRYAPDGTMQEEMSYGADGALTGWRSYVYSQGPDWECTDSYDEGQLQEREIVRHDRSSGRVHSLVYDSQGKLKRENVFPEAGVKAGGTAEYTTHESDGKIYASLVRYDNAGRATETISQDRMGNFQRHIARYDDQGNSVEGLLYDKQGSLIGQSLTSYEYDVFGNWINVTMWSVDLRTSRKWPGMIVYRNITYY